jgi:hypothetical protein
LGDTNEVVERGLWIAGHNCGDRLHSGPCDPQRMFRCRSFPVSRAPASDGHEMHRITGLLHCPSYSTGTWPLLPRPNALRQCGSCFRERSTVGFHWLSLDSATARYEQASTSFLGAGTGSSAHVISYSRQWGLITVRAWPPGRCNGGPGEPAARLLSAGTAALAVNQAAPAGRPRSTETASPLPCQA